MPQVFLNEFLSLISFMHRLNVVVFFIWNWYWTSFYIKSLKAVCLSNDYVEQVIVAYRLNTVKQQFDLLNQYCRDLALAAIHEV